MPPVEVAVCVVVAEPPETVVAVTVTVTPWLFIEVIETSICALLEPMPVGELELLQCLRSSLNTRLAILSPLAVAPTSPAKTCRLLAPERTSEIHNVGMTLTAGVWPLPVVPEVEPLPVVTPPTTTSPYLPSGAAMPVRRKTRPLERRMMV